MDFPKHGLIQISSAVYILYVCGGLVAKSCLTFATPGLKAARLHCLWDSSGKNTGVGCHFLLQRIFLTIGTKPGLLHCRQILYRLSYEGSPHIVFVYALVNILCPHIFACECVCIYIRNRKIYTAMLIVVISHSSRSICDFP